MDNEDFSRSELLKELETLRQQIVAYHLSSDIFEDDARPLSLKNINFEQLFLNLPVGIIVLDKSGQIITCNSIISDFFDFNIESIHHKFVYDALHLCRMADFSNGLQSLFRNDTAFDIESPLIISRSGVPIYLRCRGMGLDKTNTSEAQFVLIFNDITKLRLTQDSLQRNDEMYRDLVEGLEEIAFSIDLDGAIIYTNSAVERILGYKADELAGHSFAELITAEDLKEALKIFSRLLSGDSFHGPCRIRDKKDRLQWMNLSCQPLIQNERIRGVSGLLRVIGRRKGIGKTLINENVPYRELLEASSDAAFIIDNGLIIDCNSRALQVFHCKAEQLLNHALYHFSPAHQPDGSESRATLCARLERHRSADRQFFEWAFIRLDGKPFYTEVSLSATGHPQKSNLLAIVRDITERKLTEEKLRDSNLRVLMVLDSLDAAVFVMNFNHQENLFTNRIVRDHSGYFLNYNFIEKLSAEGSTTNRISSETDGRTWQRASGHFEIQHPADGRWYQARQQLIRWVDGRMARLVIAVDITNRKKAELQLQESEERLRTLINASPDIICFKDGEGRWLEANLALLELFDLTSIDYRNLTNSDIAGRPGQFSEILLRWERSEEKIWQSKTSFRANEIILRQNLPARIYDVIRLPLFYSNGERKGLVMLGRDITEQQQLEEQLRQAQKMEAIGKLASGVAHDFNNLLTIIQGYSEILIGMIEEDNPMYKGIKQIHSAATRAEALTDQLLAFSRRQVIQPKIINLIHLLKDVEPLLRRLIGEDIDLQIEHPAELFNIRCDSHQMEQVIMNIVVNARDAMPNGGVLRIDTMNLLLNDEQVRERPALEDPRCVLMTISDTGTGMEAETQARIFEPFFTTKEKGKGTGLGLSTVNDILTQNNGYVEVSSKPGQGTTFSIYLSAVEEDISIAGEASAEYIELHGNETILVVEDENDVRQLIRDVLLAYGYNILDAGDGRQALQHCRNNAPAIALLLTDVVMPHMSGRELIEQMLVFCPGIKVIFMSGYSDATIANKGVLKSGAHFLQKPFSPKSLAQKIRQVLDSR